MLNSKPISRLMAMILSIVIMVGMAPITAFAEGNDKNPLGKSGASSPATMIAAFDELPEETQYQGYDFGTELDALNLPDTLTGTDGDGNPITATSVTWESSPEFDGKVSAPFPGYEFTAVLPEEYALANGVAVPVISVFIRPEGGVGIIPLSTASDLATQIVNWSNGTVDSLTATTYGNTVTVGGSVTGATSTLTLNIDSGVTVVWEADVDFSGYTGSSSVITLNGGGTFELASGGKISGGPKYSSGTTVAYLIRVNNSVKLNITGGEAESTDNGTNYVIRLGDTSTLKMTGGTITGMAGGIYLDSSNANVFSISGGTVTCYSTVFSTASNGTGAGNVIISGGTIRRTANGTVISLYKHKVFVIGGTVESSSQTGINTIGTPTTGIAVVWDKTGYPGPI